MRRACLFLLWLLPLAALAAEPDPPFAKVVRDNRGGGSGTLVAMNDPAHTYVLTCKHVAPDGRHDYAVFSGPCAYRAEFVAADDRADLALLRIDAVLKWAQMPAEAPAVGAACWTNGCPHGGPVMLKTGTVGTGIRTRVDGVVRDWTTFSAPIEPGDSGAGVFVDGKLVGVAAAGPSPFLMVPFADVYRFLKAHELGGTSEVKGAPPTVRGPPSPLPVPGVRPMPESPLGVVRPGAPAPAKAPAPVPPTSPAPVPQPVPVTQIASPKDCKT